MLLIATVLGSYSYFRYRVQKSLDQIPKKLGIKVQQSANAFTFSKSEGGRTLFTIHAAKAVQYKSGAHTQLHDVKIVVYGRSSNRYDQIYGSDFDYDPSTGNISALGEVQIDLQADAAGPLRPDQVQPDRLKNPIHLKTRALVFNQKDGIAQTAELVEFSAAQGHGSARGAEFDSGTGTLTLVSDVSFHGDAAAANGVPVIQLSTERAVLYQRTNQVKMQQVDLKRGDREVRAGSATILLGEDGTVKRILAGSGIEGLASGPKGGEIHAQEATIEALPGNRLHTGLLSGNVTVDVMEPGQPLSHGRADQVALSFGDDNQLEGMRARGAVELMQVQPDLGGRPSSSREVRADGIDATILPGNRIDRLATVGSAQAMLTSVPNSSGAGNRKSTKTVVTAGIFTARFDDRNRIQTLHGEPRAKVVSSASGEPDRTSTSEKLEVEFDALAQAENKKAAAGDEIQTIQQEGNFHYIEDRREARADLARYVFATGLLTLTGTPWVAENGLTATAREVVLNRLTNQTRAKDNVKVTYLAPQKASGATLAMPDPIHITASAMVADSSAKTAVFSGAARLWQSSSVVEAPTIEFSGVSRSLLARGDRDHRVVCSLAERSKSGELQPIDLTAAVLDYADMQRLARFSGGVVAKGAEGTLSSDAMDVLLKPIDPSTSASHPQQESQVDRIVASGHVQVVQPGRKGNAERLTYLADAGQYTFTGSPGNPPSIFDAEQGSVTGDSLTFYSHDGRVVVDSSGLSRTITQTQGRK